MWGGVGLQVKYSLTVGGVILWGALGVAAVFPEQADISPKASWVALLKVGKLLRKVALGACTGFVVRVFCMLHLVV